MSKYRKQMISVIIFLIIILGSVSVIYAGTALPSISSSKYIATYTYASSGKVYAYTDSSLKKQDTSHYISSSSDECKIYQIKGNAVYVNYPISGGKTRTAWFKRENFTYRDLAKDAAQLKFTAVKKVTTYRWKAKATTYGYIEAGDVCYLLSGGEGSDWLQILYPVGPHYKMGWVKGTDIKSSIWAAPKPVSVSEGIYNIVSGLDTSKVIDVRGGATANCTRIQIYTYNNLTKNQIFKVVHLGSNVYKICSTLNENMALDVIGAKKESGTKIQLYQSNNSDAQKWEFYSAGNGYYYVKSKLGYYLDVTGGKTDNGTDMWVVR